MIFELTLKDYALSLLASVILHAPITLCIIAPFPTSLIFLIVVYLVYYFLLHRRHQWRIIHFHGEWKLVSNRWLLAEFLHAFIHFAVHWTCFIILYLLKLETWLVVFSVGYLLFILVPSTTILIHIQILTALIFLHRTLMKLQYDIFKDDDIQSEFETVYDDSGTDTDFMRGPNPSISRGKGSKEAEDDQLTLDDESFDDDNLSLGSTEV